MKKNILFSLAMFGLLGAGSAHATCLAEGWAISDHPIHNVRCCPVGCCPLPTVPPSCDPVPACLDILIPSTMWFDPGLIVATGLDAAATWAQKDKSVDAKEALNKLQQNLGTSASDEEISGKNSSFSGKDSAVVAPDIVQIIVDQQELAFDDVRRAVEGYVFYANDCQDDCVLERQNTWLLTSVDMAAAAADKLLATSKDEKMKDEYKALQDDFNKQISPMGLWGSSSKITLHTHVQQNDINALYARDLEMNGLNGVRESDDVRFISR